MLNTDLLDKLYADLTKEDKHKLIRLLFGDSKQSMAYFRRTKDITLSKMEVMADFFNMPLDALRLNTQYAYNVHARKIIPRPKPQNTALIKENEDLKARVKFLEQALELKTEKAEVLQMRLDLYNEMNPK